METHELKVEYGGEQYIIQAGIEKIGHEYKISATVNGTEIIFYQNDKQRLVPDYVEETEHLNRELLDRIALTIEEKCLPQD
ncbi:hypothetical protein L3C95_12740 [Chitinophaga filiformis]|uniref:hypothetical protein n=1 Tax=Chitinophaga filiformis TaxID=104663 RepID=UPI001F37FE04|nr:hypothetical protein [Chitinophaga filiformis]MCF6403750.1 hypothetical protein [Chitinophaga filiformis]